MPNIFDMGILKATVPFPNPSLRHKTVSYLDAQKQTKTVELLKLHVLRVISKLSKSKSLKQICLIRLQKKCIKKDFTFQ